MDFSQDTTSDLTFISCKLEQNVWQIVLQLSKNCYLKNGTQRSLNLIKNGNCVRYFTQILIPPKDLGVRLSKECEDYQNVLDQVKYRVDWAKYQEMQKRKEEEALERERGKQIS